MTSSPPVRLSCTTVHHSLKQLWLPGITSYWGKHLCHLYSSCHRRLLQWKNSQPQLLPPHQCPNNLLGPKDDTLCQILWRACLWAEPLQRLLWEDPPAPICETPPWFKPLKPSHAKVFSHDSDMVKEARREFFLKHSYDFTTEGTPDLSGTFRQLAASTNLLGTSIYEIQSSWTGPKELKQANYALGSLPKGLKFLHVVPPSESPKVMGLMGIHDPDALHCFGSVTYCPWCGKEGQNEGTVVNHL